VRLARVLGPALVAASACGLADRGTLPPEGQVVLYVTTDAVLPDPVGTPNGAVGLFDRLSIEIFPAGATEPCAGCARVFAIDAKMVDDGRASMGWVPRPGAPAARARIRLFRTQGAEIVEPRPPSTLETVIALPAVGAEGIVEVTAELPTATLGAPVGTLDAPAPARAGRAPRGLVGTFEAERRRPCKGELREGEVCVPGGAYWMGQPRVALAFPGTDRAIERLVVVSPFILDAAEVTVKRFRASNLADGVVGPGTHRLTPDCNYEDFETDRDEHPVNCISRVQAALYCEKQGARLPSEAEWEWVATGLGRHERYPWGEEPPGCADAVFGRQKQNAESPLYSVCLPRTGTEPVGTSARDRVVVPGSGVIVDLAGNVSEWVRDDYNEEWEPCWAAPPFILLDPVCAAKSNRFAIRGGNYRSEVNAMEVKVRSQIGQASERPLSMGFRCARASE